MQFRGRSSSSVQLLILCACTIIVGAEKCGDVDLDQWTSPSWSTPGYHVLCIGDPAGTCKGSDGEGSCPAEGSLKVTAYWNGKRTATDFVMIAPKTILDLETTIIEHQAVSNQVRHDRIKKAWRKKGAEKALYGFYAPPTSSSGRISRIVSSAVSGLSGAVLVYEGAVFIWPGIDVGFRRNYSMGKEGDKDLVVELLTKSLQPLVLEVSSFLDGTECKHVIDKAAPHMRKSGVSHMDHDVGKKDSTWRTSSTYFMPSDDEVLRRLDNRVSMLTNIGKTHGELFQILQYIKGERYEAHHDFFNPDMYKSNEMVQGMTKKGLFNRLATVFFYLSDVEAGGHTNFPRAGGLPQPRDFTDCSRGVSVKPKEGRIMIFYSQDPSGRTDEYSLHGACDVEAGIKWSANKWIWNKPMDYIRE